MKTMKFTMIALTVFVGGCCTSCYDFNREQAEKDAESNGKQILYEAEYSKQAKVEEAKANFESAKLEAETKQLVADADAKASITHATADAEVIKITSKATAAKTEELIKAFGGVDNYLKFILYTGMNNSSNRIYIPTEAGIPIIER